VSHAPARSFRHPADRDSFHLGNYLGAVPVGRAAARLRRLLLLVDLHAITVEQDPAELRQRTAPLGRTVPRRRPRPGALHALRPSHVAEHAQLAWILGCITGFGEAASHDAVQGHPKAGPDRTSVGLFIYPILQAADILLYQTELVPSARRQSTSSSRDLAQRFNQRFGETFRVPRPHIVPATAKIGDLQEPVTKMSKSASSPAGIIQLAGRAGAQCKKIRGAVTDSGREIAYPERNPGVSNMLAILSALSGREIASCGVVRRARLRRPEGGSGRRGRCVRHAVSREHAAPHARHGGLIASSPGAPRKRALLRPQNAREGLRARRVPGLAWHRDGVLAACFLLGCRRRATWKAAARSAAYHTACLDSP